MNSNFIKMGLTIILVIVVFLLKALSKKRLIKLSALYSYEPHRPISGKKNNCYSFLDCFDFFNAYDFFLGGGVNLNNIWVYLGSFLSVVAIELFAVWSILSNIISGIFIFIINPFKIGSKIKLYDPELQATVVNINLMFTELEDDDGIFNVPNNTFFQKTVKGINAEKKQPN